MIVRKYDLISAKHPKSCGKCGHCVGIICLLQRRYIHLNNFTTDIDINCPLIEVYTKDEVIAMLKDLRLEIEEIFDNRPLPCSHYQRTLFYGEVDDLILDKINALKGENNGIHEN